MVECGDVTTEVNTEAKRIGNRIDTCVCMVEFIRCSPETITTLLTGNTPVQNKKLKEKKRREDDSRRGGQTAEGKTYV